MADQPKLTTVTTKLAAGADLSKRWHIGLYAIETFGGFAGDGETMLAHERGSPFERVNHWPTFKLKTSAEAYAATLNAGSLGAYMNGLYRGVRRSGGVRYAVKVTKGPPKPYGFAVADIQSLARQGAASMAMALLTCSKPSRPAVR